jgi:ATP-dependent Lon protease
VFLLDEIDKMSMDFRGDPSAALLEVLDMEQNNTFSDHYIEAPFDLSNVMFITTANVQQSIPRPLLDRMEVIYISGYTEEEKVKIAVRHLLPKQIQEHGLTEKHLKLSENTIRKIIREYTRESGVRNLERKIATICRKTARQVVDDKTKKIQVTVQNLSLFLGTRQFRYGTAESVDQVGVATGLAWTEVGGDTLAIEISIYKGKGKLTLTGKLGDVMKESAQAGFSYIRSRSGEFGIDVEFYDKHDFHIHVPEGAIPKDGPSAGITMATALISAITGNKVRHNVAMTGEITLRGRVLPVGGIKEKVLAAHRAGLSTILLPSDNKKDLDDIPKKVKDKLVFVLAENMEEVLETALVDKDFRPHLDSVPPMVTPPEVFQPQVINEENAPIPS